MKRLLALFLLVSPALAQTVTDPTPIALVCAYNSVIPAPTSGQYAFVQCDSTGKLITAGGSGGTPGGSSGQIQYNNAGAFGGFTVSGDGTLNSSTGALVVTKTNGSAFGTAAIVNTGTSGATIPLLNAANTWGATQTFGTNALTLNGTSLLSDAADTTAFRNSTTAQKLSIYNTYTDASNYERGVLDWQTNANILTIGTQNAGTGTARQVQFQTGGTGGASGFKWVQNTTVVATLDTSAGLAPGVDDNYNFGSSNNPINVSFSITDQLLCDSVTAAMNKHNVEVLASTPQGQTPATIPDEASYIIWAGRQTVISYAKQKVEDDFDSGVITKPQKDAMLAALLK